MNSFSKKCIFERLLGASLGKCSYPILASYSWERSDRVFTAARGRDGRLLLTINLNFPTDPLLAALDRGAELTLCYRARFIESFVRLLESAAGRIPSDYFEGLVLLELICALCSGQKLRMHSVTCRGKTLTPLDIHCAIGAMTGLTLAFPDSFGADSACQQYLTSLLDYARAPEILYGGRAEPRLAHRAVLSKLQTLLKSPALREFAFLRQAISPTGELCLHTLAQGQDPTWLGLYLRSTESPDGDLADQYVRQLKEACTDLFLQFCSTDPFLIHNLEAVKLLSRGLNSAFPQITPENAGVLHYY